MFEIIKKVIESRRYELSSMLRKIDTIWLQGSISDSEKETLVNMAKENADYTFSVDIIAKLTELDNRVKVLETPSTEEYPLYEAGKWYYNGDKVTFENDKYICIAPSGQACTWSPGEYPQYWEMIS